MWLEVQHLLNGTWMKFPPGSNVRGWDLGYSFSFAESAIEAAEGWLETHPDETLRVWDKNRDEIIWENTSVFAVTV